MCINNHWSSTGSKHLPLGPVTEDESGTEAMARERGGQKRSGANLAKGANLREDQVKIEIVAVNVLVD
jgi:hypothetical protein